MTVTTTTVAAIVVPLVESIVTTIAKVRTTVEATPMATNALHQIGMILPSPLHKTRESARMMDT